MIKIVTKLGWSASELEAYDFDDTPGNSEKGWRNSEINAAALTAEESEHHIIVAKGGGEHQDTKKSQHHS